MPEQKQNSSYPSPFHPHPPLRLRQLLCFCEQRSQDEHGRAGSCASTTVNTCMAALILVLAVHSFCVWIHVLAVQSSCVDAHRVAKKNKFASTHSTRAHKKHAIIYYHACTRTRIQVRAHARSYVHHHNASTISSTMHARIHAHRHCK